MYIINLEFESLKDATIADYIDAIGVYILWNPRATTIPSYIGQGLILDRISTHSKDWLDRDFSGIIASTGEQGSRNEIKARFDAKLGEAFLLNLAASLNYRPTMNGDTGMTRVLSDQLEDCNILKVNFSGYHPFRKPGSGHCRLEDKVSVNLPCDEEDSEIFNFRCPWHKR